MGLTENYSLSAPILSKRNIDFAMTIQPIATFHSPFASKFGIPRQSGLIPDLSGYIEFRPAWRNADSLRGLEDFSHIWLIWEFSANPHQSNSPVVRPPILGGNEKRGVFATRSPFRPNPLGLSLVKIERIDLTQPANPLIYVNGADLMEGTPIYDIKPYLPHTECQPQALGGFTDTHQWHTLQVQISPTWEAKLGSKLFATLKQVLEMDPRPQYQNDTEKTYGMPFAGYDIHFRVNGDLLTVIDD